MGIKTLTQVLELNTLSTTGHDTAHSIPIKTCFFSCDVDLNQGKIHSFYNATVSIMGAILPVALTTHIISLSNIVFKQFRIFSHISSPKVGV